LGFEECQFSHRRPLLLQQLQHRLSVNKHPLESRSLTRSVLETKEKKTIFLREKSEKFRGFSLTQKNWLHFFALSLKTDRRRRHTFAEKIVILFQ
jgi:hypothetical protein